MTPLSSASADLIRSLSSPLEPLPTGETPKLPQLDGIRAVCFDVYGTLLISGSGDISLTSGVSKGSAAVEAFQAAGLPTADLSGDAVIETLIATIKQHHATSDAEYPEVDIIEIWRDTLPLLDQRYTSLCEDDESLTQLAIEYECRVNPIWPMPGAGECLTALREANFSLGIVSNAQFFTRDAFPALLGRPLADLGLPHDLCIWSFAHLQAKPGRCLYDRSAEAFAEHDISPAEVLYVGNDLRNDVWPAQQVGFRTVLFAGDKRSLRWRRDDLPLINVMPDAVITELRQLLTILSLAPA